jgi:hypothetical protein
MGGSRDRRAQAQPHRRRHHDAGRKLGKRTLGSTTADLSEGMFGANGIVGNRR